MKVLKLLWIFLLSSFSITYSCYTTNPSTKSHFVVNCGRVSKNIWWIWNKNLTWWQQLNPHDWTEKKEKSTLCGEVFQHFFPLLTISEVVTLRTNGMDSEMRVMLMTLLVTHEGDQTLIMLLWWGRDSLKRIQITRDQKIVRMDDDWELYKEWWWRWVRNFFFHVRAKQEGET